MPKHQYNWEELTGQLYDELAALAERAEDGCIRGINIYGIVALLGVKRRTAYEVIKRLRTELGAGSYIGVPTFTNGRQRYYYLTDNRRSGKDWENAHVQSVQSRLHMVLHWIENEVNVTDGRYKRGRNARDMRKALLRIDEDIQDYIGDHLENRVV